MEDELSKRDRLYNAVLKVVKDNADGMDIGLVRAVLAEVEGEIGMKTGRLDFSIVNNRLKERKPRRLRCDPQGSDH